MQQFIIATILIALLALATTSPLPSTDPRSEQDLQLMWDDISDSDRAEAGIQSGLVDERYRWPNKVVSYEFDPTFNESERATILEGMNDIASKTCITFRVRTTESDYVYVRRGAASSGCSSSVGKIGGRQTLNLQAPQPGAGHCIHAGTAAHEFIHAIGFTHEQNRPDRDEWVSINWENIPIDKQHNFEKKSESTHTTFGTPYEYASVMHYASNAFAIDKDVATIIPLQLPGAQMGGDIVTATDALKINKMYNCV